MQIGSRLKALRLASDLTQAELANRARLTKGFISQLENEHFQTSISVDSLADILEALDVSISEFFADDEAPVLFGPSDRIEVDETGADRFELLVPGSTNHLMDPIMVSLMPGNKMNKRAPHSGEQFGYVLKGVVTLKAGKRTFRVPRKHCFYLKSDRTHQIINDGKAEATFLWIMSPPQM